MYFSNAGIEAEAASAGTAPRANPGPAPPLLSSQNVTGRFSDRFAFGYLGGVGGASQFQGAQGSLLPVLPPASNNDLLSRNISSRGITTGQHLMTRWERPGNFNPGLGTDTWRGGDNVTWTLGNRGHFSPATGVFGPLTYPAIPHLAVHRDPLPPFNSIRQGLAGNQLPPKLLVGSTSGYQGGTSLAEMRQMAASQYQNARKGSGAQRRHMMVGGKGKKGNSVRRRRA